MLRDVKDLPDVLLWYVSNIFLFTRETE